VMVRIQLMQICKAFFLLILKRMHGSFSLSVENLMFKMRTFFTPHVPRFLIEISENVPVPNKGIMESLVTVLIDL
jgi:hypothetical protein